MWYNLTILFTVGSSLQNLSNSTRTAVYMSVNGGLNDSRADDAEQLPPARVIVEAPFDASMTRKNMSTVPMLAAVDLAPQFDAAAVEWAAANDDPPPPVAALAPIPPVLDSTKSRLDSVLNSIKGGRVQQPDPKPPSGVIVETPAWASLKANITEAIAVGMQTLGKGTNTTGGATITTMAPPTAPASTTSPGTTSSTTTIRVPKQETPTNSNGTATTRPQPK